jgi:hypothetical protein
MSCIFPYFSPEVPTIPPLLTLRVREWHEGQQSNFFIFEEKKYKDKIKDILLEPLRELEFVLHCLSVQSQAEHNWNKQENCTSSTRVQINDEVSLQMENIL